jgi:hypothetical protein
VNRFMRRVFQSEQRWLTGAGPGLPFGVSVLAVGRRSDA